MNCSQARRALGLGTPRRDAELERHLLECARCRELAAFERRIDEARLALLAVPPPIADVRGRVLAAIADLEPERSEERRSLVHALAATLLALGLCGLLTMLAADRLPWHDASHALRGLLEAAGQSLSLLAGIAAAAVRATLRLMAALEGLLRPAAALATRMEPGLAAALGLGYVAMAGTILFVLGRDLRRSAGPSLED